MSRLDDGTLVLNKSWLAIQVCSVKRAISLVFQGHAKVVDADYNVYDFNDWHEISQQMVETDEGDFICSPTIKIRVPRIILLLAYDKLPKRDIAFSRKNILERDNYQCQYCGVKPPRGNRAEALKWLEKNSLSLDHVIPRSKGGKTTWENIVTCCFKCNSKKGSRSLNDLGWKLIQTPTKPKGHPTLNINIKRTGRKEWVNFLDLAYYNVELEHENE